MRSGYGQQESWGTWVFLPHPAAGLPRPRRQDIHAIAHSHAASSAPRACSHIMERFLLLRGGGHGCALRAAPSVVAVAHRPAVPTGVLTSSSQLLSACPFVPLAWVLHHSTPRLTCARVLVLPTHAELSVNSLWSLRELLTACGHALRLHTSPSVLYLIDGTCVPTRTSARARERTSTRWRAWAYSYTRCTAALRVPCVVGSAYPQRCACTCTPAAVGGRATHTHAPRACASCMRLVHACASAYAGNRVEEPSCLMSGDIVIACLQGEDLIAFETGRPSASRRAPSRKDLRSARSGADTSR
ncbi:hypothetical protein EON67_06580, partial [archaeon]